jgi:hypothetical protein
MNKIFLLALAGLLTIGTAAYASGNPKGKQKECKSCTQKICTPDCKAHCGKGCCAKAS